MQAETHYKLSHGHGLRQHEGLCHLCHRPLVNPVSVVREAAKVYQGCRHMYHVSCLNISHREQAMQGCPLCVSTDVYRNLFFAGDNDGDRRGANAQKRGSLAGRKESLDTLDSEPDINASRNDIRLRQMEAFEYALAGGKLTYDDFADDV